jgi:hypothetical protein
MANNLILRSTTSPYGDQTKGSVLSHQELDDNLIFLKGISINSASINGSTLNLNKLDGSVISVDLSAYDTQGSVITGGTFSAQTGTLFLNNASGGTITITGFSTEILYTNLTPTTATVGGITAGSTFTNQTMQQMWDKLLYPYQPPAFTSFALQGISSPLEIGYDIPLNSTFTWSTSNSSNVATNSISINGYNLTTLTGLANDGSEAVTFTSNVTRDASDSPGTRVWGISGVNTSGNTFSSSLTIRWDYRIYVGVSANESLTESDIESLSVNNSIKQGFTGTYSFPAGDTYKYICYADVYGTPTSFTTGGFPTAMWSGYANPGPGSASYDLVSVTNTYGETVNYRVYRTTNKLNSAVSIIVA